MRHEETAATHFVLALGGVVFSGCLTYLEVFVIEAICSWCIASAIFIPRGLPRGSSSGLAPACRVG